MQRTTLYYFISLILLCILAYIIQAHIYLHKDVAIISHTAAAMLTGETYGKYIYEPNPPMIFYLSMPAIVVAKLMSISVIPAFRIYFITLIVTSISCSYYILKKLFTNSAYIVNLAAYVMAYVLLFLPAHQFGQREHFLLVLILPYLFASTLYLENKKLNWLFSSIIGLMAGIGFAIKPHFLPALLLIELYVCYQKRSCFGWIRIETISILAVFFSYAAAVLMFYPDYLKVVLPLWMPYYQAVAHPLLTILGYPLLLYCLILIILYYMTLHLIKNIIVCNLFLCALIGFICSYLLPRVAWYYHIYPAFCIACLLATLIVGQLIREKNITLQIALLGMIYLFPLLLSIQYTAIAIRSYNADTPLSRLIHFFKDKKTTFDVLAVNHDSIALEYYTSAQYIGSFPILMWEYNQVLIKYRPNSQAMIYENNRPRLINLLAEEIAMKKPDYILVDIPSSTNYLGIPIDYINQYKQYKNFKTAWKPYHYSIAIGPYKIYTKLAD